MFFHLTLKIFELHRFFYSFMFWIFRIIVLFPGISHIFEIIIIILLWNICHSLARKPRTTFQVENTDILNLFLHLTKLFYMLSMMIWDRYILRNCHLFYEVLKDRNGFLIVLLRYSSHTTQLTHLKCTIQ